MQKNAFSKKLMAGGAVLLSLSAAQVAQAQLTLQLVGDAANVTSGGNGTAVTSWNDQGSSSSDVTGAGLTAPTWNSGAVNSSLIKSGYLTFDGSDDVLANTSVLGSSLFNSTTATIMLVLRPGANAADTMFSWKADGVENYLQAAENPGPFFYSGNTGASIPDPSNWEGNWHLLTLVRNGSSSDIRVDGVSLGSSGSSFPTAMNLGAGAINIGHTVNQAGQYWAGDIAEVRVYNNVPGTLGGIEASLMSDYNLAPVPEPSQYATVFSLICVAGALVYRQRRQRALAS